MEHAFPFIVITLLQLCGAEIPNAQAEWYAANLINDPNYSPKPLTEIFSTDASFTLRTTETRTSPTTVWTTTTTSAPSTNPSTWDVTQTQVTPQLENISRPQPPPAMSQVTASDQPQVNWQSQTQPPLMASSPQSVPQSTPQSNPQPVPTAQTPLTSTLGLWRNQGNWLRGNQLGNRPGLWDPNQPNWIPNQQGNIQPFLPLVVPQSETPLILPSGPVLNAPCDRRLNPISSQGAILSNIPQNPIATNTNSSLANTNQTSGQNNPILTISVKRKGSRTNVLINPSTTSATTTTRRNTRRNNYDMCVDSCRNRKEPICASPRGVTPINPDNLKGFPSMCNMACQNSFRNQQYEKVADGRCGKLRTRIRPVGQNKLNRNDLNKAQYTLVHDGDETVIEFAQLPRAA